MSIPGAVTPAELNAQLELEQSSMPVLLKKLAALTATERSISKSLKLVKDSADEIEAIVLERMLADDVPSQTIATPDGKKMKFTVSSKSFPKMELGSRQAAFAVTAYANRLRLEGRDTEADMMLDLLTIKGQSLEPLFREWLAQDKEFPPEFEGVITPSTRFSLSKTTSR